MTEPETPAAPRTEAGRALLMLAETHNLDCADPAACCFRAFIVDGHRILAIEAEAAALAARPALDVDELGFADLLDIGDAILRKAYPPDTIVCSHDPQADIGARTTAAIADLIASCRARLAPQEPSLASLPTEPEP